MAVGRQRYKRVGQRHLRKSTMNLFFVCAADPRRNFSANQAVSLADLL